MKSLSTQDAESHAAIAQLHEYLHGRLSQREARRTGAHLAACSQCASQLMAVRPPQEYIFGRPVLPVSRFDPIWAERLIEEVIGLCLARLPAGGCVVVGGNWCSETVTLRILSLALVRLARRHGLPSQVAGSPYVEDAAPPVPGAPLSLLLEANLYEYAGAWRQCEPGRVTILCGRIPEWRLPVDVVVSREPDESALAALAGFSRLLEPPDEKRPMEALLAAAACDLPAGLFPRLAPVQTPPGGPTPYGACRGGWVAREAVARWFVDQLPARHPYIPLSTGIFPAMLWHRLRRILPEFMDKCVFMP